VSRVSYNSRDNRGLFNAVAFYGKQLSAIYLARRVNESAHVRTRTYARVCEILRGRVAYGVINRVMDAAKAKVIVAEPRKVHCGSFALLSPPALFFLRFSLLSLSLFLSLRCDLCLEISLHLLLSLSGPSANV